MGCLFNKGLLKHSVQIFTTAYYSSVLLKNWVLCVGTVTNDTKYTSSFTLRWLQMKQSHAGPVAIYWLRPLNTCTGDWHCWLLQSFKLNTFLFAVLMWAGNLLLCTAWHQHVSQSGYEIMWAELISRPKAPFFACNRCSIEYKFANGDGCWHGVD